MPKARVVARVIGVVPESANSALGPFIPLVVQLNLDVDPAKPLKPGTIVEARIRLRVHAVISAPLPNLPGAST